MNANLNMTDILATAKREFAESVELQAEFGGDETAYIAFKKGEAQGLIGNKTAVENESFDDPDEENNQMIRQFGVASDEDLAEVDAHNNQN